MVVSVLVTLLAATAAAAQPKTFTETTSVVAVEVPVTVTRGGHPVPDLEVENFKLYDGKIQQKISDFRVIDLTRPETRDVLEHRIPMAARRHFLMFFDMAFSKPDSLLKARDAAKDLVDRLHPSDLAGVVTYNSLRGAEIVLNFTSDRGQLRLAIDTLGITEINKNAGDTLGLVIGDTPRDPHGEEGMRKHIREVMRLIAQSEKTAQLNRISVFTSNMESLAQVIAALEGRKHLVYFSEGIPDDLISDDQIVDGSNILTNARSAPVAGSFSTETSNIGNTSRTQNQLESMIEAFRRADCLIQAVDIGGARTLHEIGGRATGEDSLVAMSKDTGGEFFRNFNDLGAALDQMLDRNTITYLLTFQPQELPLDGGYHRLRVELVDLPRGTKASHRDGYYARSLRETSDSQRRMETAGIVMSDEDSGELDADLFVSAIPIEGEQAYVALMLELDGASILEGGARDALALEIYAYATDSQGGVHDFFDQAIGLDLARVKARLRRGGVKFWGHFDLPPGDYTARIMVRERHGGHYAMRQKPFTVPADGAILQPPLFPEPPAQWLVIREMEQRRRFIPYPFMADGQPYIPAAKPRLPARGSTPLILRATQLPGKVEFVGEVVLPDGTPVAEAGLEVGPCIADAGVHTAVAHLETHGLRPGEYILVSTAFSDTGAAWSSSIRFVVP